MWNESFSYSIIQRGNSGGRQKKVIFRPQFWAWGLCGPAERQRGLMQTGDCKWDTKICIHTPIHYRKLGGEISFLPLFSIFWCIIFLWLSVSPVCTYSSKSHIVPLPVCLPDPLFCAPSCPLFYLLHSSLFSFTSPYCLSSAFFFRQPNPFP